MLHMHMRLADHLYLNIFAPHRAKSHLIVLKILMDNDKRKEYDMMRRTGGTTGYSYGESPKGTSYSYGTSRGIKTFLGCCVVVAWSVEFSFPYSWWCILTCPFTFVREISKITYGGPIRGVYALVPGAWWHLRRLRQNAPDGMTPSPDNKQT